MEHLYAILLIVGFILTACCVIAAVRGKTCSKLWYVTMTAYIAYGVCASVALKDWRQIGVGFLFVCACYFAKIAWNVLKAKIKHEKYSAKTDIAIFAATLVLFIVGMMLPYDKAAAAQRAAESEAREIEKAASSVAADSKKAEAERNEALKAESERRAAEAAASSKKEEPASKEQSASEKAAEEERNAAIKAESEKRAASSKASSKSQAASKVELSEDKYKELCAEVDYKDLCRYPDKYSHQRIKVKVKIQQVMDSSLFSSEKAYRMMTDNDGYGLYLDDEYYVIDERDSGAVKLLEDDIVLIYGKFGGMKKVTRALTWTTDEVPSIEMKYAEIVKE